MARHRRRIHTDLPAKFTKAWRVNEILLQEVAYLMRAPNVPRPQTESFALSFFR